MNKPNIVYVFADQLRYSSLGYNGDHLAKTPNIDRIASKCCVLDNAISGHPVCAPYRATLFTGKYTTSTGMVINEIRISTNHKTIANCLTENGYETSYIGKWHIYANKFNDHQNVESSYIPEGENRLGFDGYFAAYNFHHNYYAPKAYYHLNTPEKIYYDGYEPDCQTDMAIKEIERLIKLNKPFALFLSIGTPHDPWDESNVPKEYLEKFKDVIFDLPKNYRDKNDKHADMWARLKKGERKKILDWMKVYYAMVNNLDDNVGRVYDYLERNKLLENTIFVFTSDHGEMFGAHGRRAKNIFYEESVRVPFLIKGAGIKEIKNDIPFNTVDIMPTLLSLCGIESPKEVEGEDLSKYLIDGTSRNEGCLMMGTGPTAIYGNGREWRGIRNKQYTYAVYRSDGEELLFDNVNDPLQMNNLIDDEKYSQLKQSLKSEMYSKMGKIRDEFSSNLYYRRYWINNRIIKPILLRSNEIKK